MPDVTAVAIEEMEQIFGGLARRARAELGVTAWGMQVFTLPANWNEYPMHKHERTPSTRTRRRCTSRSRAARSWWPTGRSTSCAPE
jgi:hypothetical protein